MEKAQDEIDNILYNPAFAFLLLLEFFEFLVREGPGDALFSVFFGQLSGGHICIRTYFRAGSIFSFMIFFSREQNNLPVHG